MKHIKNAVIVSGGNIDVDFALDFLKKIKRKEPFMIAADRGLEFFEKTGLVPDAAVGEVDGTTAETFAGEKGDFREKGQCISRSPDESEGSQGNTGAV